MKRQHAAHCEGHTGNTKMPVCGCPGQLHFTILQLLLQRRLLVHTAARAGNKRVEACLLPQSNITKQQG